MRYRTSSIAALLGGSGSAPPWQRYIAACAIVAATFGGLWLNSRPTQSDHVTVMVEGQGKVVIPRERGESDQAAATRFALQRQLDERRPYDPAESFEYAQKHPEEAVQIWPPVDRRCRTAPLDCWANQRSPFSTR